MGGGRSCRKILEARWNNFLGIHVVPTYRRIKNVLKLAGNKNKLSVELSQLLYNNYIMIVLTICLVIG